MPRVSDEELSKLCELFGVHPDLHNPWSQVVCDLIDLRKAARDIVDDKWIAGFPQESFHSKMKILRSLIYTEEQEEEKELKKWADISRKARESYTKECDAGSNEVKEDTDAKGE